MLYSIKNYLGKTRTLTDKAHDLFSDVLDFVVFDLLLAKLHDVFGEKFPPPEPTIPSKPKFQLNDEVDIIGSSSLFVPPLETSRITYISRDEKQDTFRYRVQVSYMEATNKFVLRDPKSVAERVYNRIWRTYNIAEDDLALKGKN